MVGRLLLIIKKTFRLKSFNSFTGGSYGGSYSIDSAPEDQRRRHYTLEAQSYHTHYYNSAIGPSTTPVSVPSTLGPNPPDTLSNNAVPLSETISPLCSGRGPGPRRITSNIEGSSNQPSDSGSYTSAIRLEHEPARDVRSRHIAPPSTDVSQSLDTRALNLNFQGHSRGASGVSTFLHTPSSFSRQTASPSAAPLPAVVSSSHSYVVDSYSADLENTLCDFNEFNDAAFAPTGIVDATTNRQNIFLEDTHNLPQPNAVIGQTISEMPQPHIFDEPSQDSSLSPSMEANSSVVGPSLLRVPDGDIAENFQMQTRRDTDDHLPATANSNLHCSQFIIDKKKVHENPKKRQRASFDMSDHDDDGIKRRFACPYYLRHPTKYMRERSCPGPGWVSVHRLK